jgi:hypothetical protein
MKRIAIAIAVALVVLVATAGVLSSAEADYTQVTKIQVGDDNYLWVNVAGNFNTTIHGCTNGAWARSSYQLNDERTKALESLAIASFLGRRPVYVWTSGCTGPGTNGYAIITKLSLHEAGA